MADLTFAQVNSVLKYDPETGKLFWLPRPPEMFPTSGWGREQSCRAWNARYAGKEALTAPKDGYRSGSIFDFKFRAHRVAWLLHYGQWPSKHIDHINGDRADNRISNLRDVNRTANQRNQKRRADNKSGVGGVHFNQQNQKWKAEMRVGRKKIHLGFFSTAEEAIAARLAANTSYGFSPRHGT